VEAFPRLREDLDRVAAASTMAEAVDAVAQEKEPSVALFELLAAGLRALEPGPAHPDLVVAFLLHLAGVVGVAPAFEACAACGRSDSLERFSFSAGGVVCAACRPEGSLRLRPGLIAYLAALSRAPLDRLPPADPALGGEAMGITRRFVEFHLDRRLASPAVLDA
jgi:DNA repair protein RecO (recombination protein O)